MGMDLVTALYSTYEYALKNHQVDRHNGQTVLLPLFHNSLRSTGSNVVEVELTAQGELFDAHFKEKDVYLIFPVTYLSSTRSGKMPPPHPLFDKAIYLVPSELEHHQLYREEFLNWKKSVKDPKVQEFLNLIDQLIYADDWFDRVLSRLYSDYTRKELVVTDRSGTKPSQVNFKDIYFHFKINHFLDGKDMDITNYVALHKAYVDYVEGNLVHDGICNISGQEDFISRKHRGLLGNSRLISVSNNTETYRGRFKSGDDIFNLGFTTSEKAHLMLRYLTENPNSNQFLGDTQYLINWFSDDISNTSQINLMNPNEDVKASRYRKIVSKQNQMIGSSFFKGQIQFNEKAQYFILILDKSSAGRVSIKYFKSLPVSELLERLKKWNDLYHWPTYIEERGELVNRVPSFYNLMISTYGVERTGKLVVDNKKFTKDQIQKMITAMIEGHSLPQNIVDQLAQNIRMRSKYDKTWGQMKRVALAVLRNKRKERYHYMLDKDNTNRSYLFGRLLAVYELIESAVYSGSHEGSDRRVTNAEKFWTSYINSPARTQVTLERNVHVYLNKLSKSEDKRGLAIKYKRAKSEIINEIAKLYDENAKELAKPLDFDFIFGYEGQKSELFKTKEEQEEE